MTHEHPEEMHRGPATGARRIAGPRLLATTSALALAIAASHPGAAQAQTLPAGGTVTSGNATIGGSGGNLIVNQTSKNAILSWDSFSIGSGARAHFENGSGATLNRVTGNVPSSIDGLLTSTGSVYLVNPSGIAVGTGGMVRTGGSFVASTHDATDTDFLNGGDLTLKGNSKASVANRGTITAKSGDVVLTARQVENTGTIDAEKGSAGLLAGYEVLLRDTKLADGKFAVRVGGRDTKVVNSGGIRAADVELRANGGNVQALAGNTSETIKATGVSRSGGRVFLTAGEDGTVEATQKIVARRAVDPAKQQAVATLPDTGPLPASRPYFTGGDVQITGGTVKLGGSILADGGGAAGGRIVAIAGNRIELADTTRLDASGKTGGFVETSGQNVRIEAGARVTTLGTNRVGQWLIDPTDFTISAGSGAMTASGIGADTLVANLATTDITLQTQSAGADAGDIHVSADLDWSSSNTLTLDAHNDIHIDGEISAFNGGLILNAVGTISASEAIEVAAFTLTSGNWVQNSSSLPDFRADDFRITGGSFLRATGGSGTGADPYMIGDIYGLQGIGTHLSRNFRLSSDIEAFGTIDWNGGDGFDPIGDDPAFFSGSIDGAGHTITGLSIYRPTENYVGLVGYLGAGGSISNLGIVQSRFDGADITAALAGRNEGGTISNSYASQSLVSGGIAVGGLVGFNNGTINQSYATGAVDGQHYSGGLVGQNAASGFITQSYANGDVSGITLTGGLVGNNDGTVLQAYATGAVTGNRFVGGLVGNVGGTGSIDQVYSTGAVEGSMDVGALLGANAGGSVANAYWNTETGGQTIGVGTGTTAGTSGLTTGNMLNGLPAGFDPAAWGHLAGISYPYFKWRFATGPTVVSGNVRDLIGGNGRAGVDLAINGALVGHTTSGANGYYQLMSDPVAAGAAAFALLDGSYVGGATSGFGNAIGEIVGVGGHLTGFDLIDNTITVRTSIDTMAGIYEMMGTATFGDGTFIPFPFLIADPNALLAVALPCGCGGWEVDYFPGSNAVFNVDAATLTIDTEMGSYMPAGELTIRGNGNIAFASGGYVAADNVTIDAAGDLSFAFGSGVDGLGTGDAVRLSAGGIFTNDAGSDLIWLDDPSAARWLVYLKDPTAAHVYGDLDSANRAVWNTQSLTGVAQSGNRYAFDYQPTLTITTLDRSKIYGNAIDLSTAYVISGVLGSVSGAYIGDTIASAFSGAPTITSAGTAVTSGVGHYQITAGPGTLTSSAGYDFAFANTGTLNVTPRALTITADDIERFFGSANPSLTYTIGGLGLVNGDTLSGLLQTLATTTSPGGSYSITQGTLTAGGNYDVTFNAGELTVIGPGTADPLELGSTEALAFFQPTGGLLTLSSGDDGCSSGVLGPACASTVHPGNR